MANTTFKLLSNITVSGTPTTITFSSIPQTGTDLMIVSSLKAVDGTGSDNYNNFLISLNGANVSTAYWVGGDMSGGSGGGTSSFLRAATTRDNYLSPFKFYVTNYSSTTKAKQGLARIWAFDNSTPSINIWGASWASTSAVTSITLTNTTNTWRAGSQLSLYEITKL